MSTERGQQYDALQGRVAGWKHLVIPRHLNTARGEFDRALEEVQELDTAIAQHDGSRKSELEIGYEGADVIVRMMGIMAVVHCNSGQLLDNKINEIYKKYPPGQINRMMAQGLPWEAAMKTAKNIWNSNQNGNGNGSHR